MDEKGSCLACGQWGHEARNCAEYKEWKMEKLKKDEDKEFSKWMMEKLKKEK